MIVANAKSGAWPMKVCCEVNKNDLTLVGNIVVEGILTVNERVGGRCGCHDWICELMTKCRASCRFRVKSLPTLSQVQNHSAYRNFLGHPR